MADEGEWAYRASPRLPAPPRHRREESGTYWRRRTVVGGLIGLAGFGAVRGLAALRGDREPGTVQVGEPDDPTATTGPPSQGTTRNIIEIENALTGTSDFAFPFENEVVDLIHAYCGRDSAHRGEAVTVYATTEAATFTAEAFRMGYYGGAGARLVWSGGPYPGLVQPDPEIDTDTGMRECLWAPSFEVTVGDEWTPGMYLFRLKSDDGGATHVPLVVLDDREADLLVVSAVTTWQAYNHFGGASLYNGPDGLPATRAQVVSYDRPYEFHGSGHFFGGEWEFVQLAESLGIDVAYTTDVDLHARPGQTTTRGYKAIVSLAHDEYYSLEMRDALEAARAAGVNLMFLGANAIFRRIRLEPSVGGPLRRQVNYRVGPDDPLYSDGDQRLVTAEWRRPPAAAPESELIGNFYESNPCEGDMVVADADSWVFAGTGLADGDSFPLLVGNEYDRVTLEQPTPANIQVLCHSPLVVRDKETFADMTYYTHRPSGAGVWATGTLWWERHLGPLCTDAGAAAGDHAMDCHIRRITANVLEVFIAGPAGDTHPSVPNLARLGIRPGYVTDPPPG